MKGSLPIREDLVRAFDKRRRLANRSLLGFGASWGVAILLAILASNVPATGYPAGAGAGLFFVCGFVVFLVAIIYLTKLVGTIPLRCRLVLGTDDRAYLKVVNANHAFAAALARHDSEEVTDAPTPGDSPVARVAAPPTVRARLVARPRALAAYLLVYGLVWVWFLISSVQRHDYLVIAVISLLGVAFVPVGIALKWQLRIGKFILSPAKATAMIMVGSLSGALGLIGSLNPTSSGSANPAVGAAAAIGAMVFFVVVGVVYSNIRAIL